MTSRAATSAGRTKTTQAPPKPRPATKPHAAPAPHRAPKPQARSAGSGGARSERRTIRSSGVVPRVPRRVSGPARGAAGAGRLVGGPGRLGISVASAGAAAATLVPPRVGLPPRIALPKRTRRPAARPAEPPLTRLAGWLRTLPDRRWLDRLVRGRAWIPVLGVLLTGIVAMQVEVLKLGASIGRSVSLATQLQSRNQLLRASVAQLSDDGRIERLAVGLGMVLPGPTQVHFVSAGGGGILQKAMSSIHSPDATGFLSGLSSEQAAAVAQDPTTTILQSTGASAGSATAPAPAAATPTSQATSSGGTAAGLG